MFDFIEKIRTKSDREKRRITLATSAGVTLIIFVVWIFVVAHNISNLSEVVDTSSNTPSPFAQIGDSFSKVFDSMSNIFKNTDIAIPQTDSSSTTILQLEAPSTE